VFTSEERRIFRVTLRGQTSSYDPLKVRRIMLKGTGGELYKVWRKAVSVARLLNRGEAVPEDALEAEEVLLQAAREAMGLDEPTEAGAGYTDSEVWLAVDQFGAFLKKAPGEGGSWPASSPPSQGSPSDAPAPTPSASACTSTSSVPG